MKKLHKTNAIILWAGMVFFIAYTTLEDGWVTTTKITDAILLADILIIAVLYFAKINDVVKGTGMTVLTAVTCLVNSIMLGGDAPSFLVSYIMLGMALIYFNKKIMVAFLSIYMPICIAAALVNPAYIGGAGTDTATCVDSLFSFAVLGILTVIATARGGKLVEDSSTMLQKIKADAGNTESVIRRLNESMNGSSENMGSLAEQTRLIGEAADEMESFSGEMNASAGRLDSLVGDTVGALSRNVDLNRELEKQFGKVGDAVASGSDGAIQVKSALDTMKQTVLAASDATQELLGKISSVNSILKEINKITVRTGMLSINASIEAAKAGASGRGFAVVAEEIKSLADESGDSAKEIQQIISELFRQVYDVAAKIAAGTQSAMAGMESVEQLLGTLTEIRAANDIVGQVVGRETQTNDNVSSRFRTVSEEIEMLVGNVASINEAVEKVAADIRKQNEAILNVNGEIGRMKAVTNDLDRGGSLRPGAPKSRRQRESARLKSGAPA